MERKLSNLYRLVEDTKIKIDPSLGSRIREWQDELAEITSKMNSLKVQVMLPKDLFARVDLQSFRAAMLSILTEPDSSAAKTFIHLAADEIRIYADETTISGSNLGVLEAVLEQTGGAAPSVPSFMHNWRRARRSESRDIDAIIGLISN